MDFILAGIKMEIKRLKKVLKMERGMVYPRLGMKMDRK